jgi:hypothetical protein
VQLIGGCCLVIIYHHSAIGQTNGVALLASEETFFSELGYVMRLGRFSSLVVTYHHSGTEQTNGVALLKSGETFSELVIMTTEGGN